MSSNKQTLVLIHGWGFNKTIWQFNLDYLESQYNIIALDLNGHGTVEFNPDYNNLNNYLESIVTQIPVDSHILGWSLGGIIALNLKYKFPNHINKIILCCSNPCFLSNNNWPYGVDSSIWHKFSNDLILNPHRTIKNFLLLQTLDHPESKKLFKDLLAILNLQDLRKTTVIPAEEPGSPKIDPGSARFALDRDDNLQTSCVSPDLFPTASIEGLKWGLDILQQDHRHILSHINQQDTSFIFGSKDNLVNKKLAVWLEQNFENIFITTINSGHLPFITNQQEFYQHIDNYLCQQKTI